MVHLPMAELDRILLRTKIEASLKQLEEEIAELRELTKPIAPENAIGRVSRMDAINNKSINEAALRKSEEKNKQLKYALSRIDEADFGLCGRCGEAIQEGRIMLMPESNYCVRCAAR